MDGGLPMRPMLRLTTQEGGDGATSLRVGNVRGRSAGADAGRGEAGHARGLVAGRVQPAGAARVEARAGVGDGTEASAARRARAAVGAENHQAAMQAPDPRDPLWILAERTAASLEGGRAAVLSPEKRARLIGLGTDLGLRAFDSHLVIAIVQDGARTGDRAVAGEPARRLGLLGGRRSRAGGLAIGVRLSAAALLAVAMVSVVIGWIDAV